MFSMILQKFHIFRNILQAQPKLLLDATISGSLMFKSAEDAISIIDLMALNEHQVNYNTGASQLKVGTLELGTNDAIFAHNKLLTQTMEELTKQLSNLPQNFCELCTGDQLTGFCPLAGEEVNYMEN